MLSRVADSLFWMSRNIERVDNNARLITVKFISTLEHFDPNFDYSKSWKELLSINGNEHIYFQKYNDIQGALVLDFLTFCKDNPSSIASCIEISRENAKSIREMIPLEMWEMLNLFHWKLQQHPKQLEHGEKTNEFYQMIKDQSCLFQGIVEALMSRGEAYLFIKLGKYLERAHKMAKILDVYYNKEMHDKFNKETILYHHWASVLQSVSGHESYLKKYHSFIQTEKVLELLVFDDQFPRSIRFCAEQVLACFMELEDKQIKHYNEDLYQKINKLIAILNSQDIKQLKKHPHDFFQKIQHECNEIGSAIMKTYYLGDFDIL